MDNYKKKYEEALERARLSRLQLLDIGEEATEIEYIFPELKEESEDEKIRKELITHCRNTRCVTEEGAERIAKWIDWLEKQGEHANFLSKIQVGDKVTRNEAGVLVNLSQLRRVAKPRKKQGEEKPRYSVGDVLCDKSCTTLNKKSQPNFEITDIRNGMYICDKCSFPISQQDEYELVAKRIEQKPTFEMKTPEESLGISSEEYKKIVDTCLYDEKIESKPAWTEEDKRILDALITSLINERFAGRLEFLKGIKVSLVIDWLRSLKEKIKGE